MRLIKQSFDKYVFVVTGMSYIVDASGTSKVVQAHQDIFQTKEIGFVSIFPICKNYKKSTIKTGCYALIINGHLISIISAKEVLNCLLQMHTEGKKCIGILIHHIIRNDLNEISFMLNRIDNVPIIYYLHDFYTCCTNYNMLKNDEISCIDNNLNCDNCVYARKNEVHIKKIKLFLIEFEERMTFVAPSGYVKEKWSKFYPKYANKTIVIPHQTCLGQYLGNKTPLKRDETIRIAFVGKQISTKGWDYYKRILRRLQNNRFHYSFYYFGKPKEHIKEVHEVYVDISKMGKNAMINAIRDSKIDIVLLLSTVAETYSYTMYESHAANAFIITTNTSGNIACTTIKERWGKVFDTEDEILSFLMNEKKTRETINEWKKDAAPGCDEYEDNNEIVDLFPQNKMGSINWSKKRSLADSIKSFVVFWIFTLMRLK